MERVANPADRDVQIPSRSGRSAGSSVSATTDVSGHPHTTYLADTTRFQTSSGSTPLGPSELDVLAATLRGDILWAAERYTPAGQSRTSSTRT